MPSRKNDIWLLVADGSKARILCARPLEAGLVLVDELEAPAARLKRSELMADRPGRSLDSSHDGQRSGMEPPTDPKVVEKHKFAQRLAEHLARGADEHHYGALVVVASPKMLGELRQILPERVRSLIRHEVDKDLTSVPTHELRAHLGDNIRI